MRAYKGSLTRGFWGLLQGLPQGFRSEGSGLKVELGVWRLGGFGLWFDIEVAVEADDLGMPFRVIRSIGPLARISPKSLAEPTGLKVPQ